jgi:transposase
MEIITIGLDLAKSVFQVHCVDAVGDVVVRKPLRRRQVLPFFAKLSPCLIGMEACGTSHYWARELGLHHALALAARLAAGEVPEVPSLAQRIVVGLARQIGDLQDRLTAIERELLAWHRSNELSQRLATIPGIGVISATALAASVIEPERFRSGRQFAASLGLTPLANCSGGKERLGKISRMGDRYLRRLLVVGMTSLVRRARIQPASVDPRLSAMLARKPARLVTVAAANRTARVAWAIMTRGGTYRAPISAAA